MEEEVREKFTATTNIGHMAEVMMNEDHAAAGVIRTILNSGCNAEIIGGLIAKLADMNIRSRQLYFAFKEVCKNDLLTLGDKLDHRDQAMVDAVNAACQRVTRYKAVTHGALTMDKLPTFE